MQSERVSLEVSVVAWLRMRGRNETQLAVKRDKSQYEYVKASDEVKRTESPSSGTCEAKEVSNLPQISSTSSTRSSPV